MTNIFNFQDVLYSTPTPQYLEFQPGVSIFQISERSDQELIIEILKKITSRTNYSGLLKYAKIGKASITEFALFFWDSQQSGGNLELFSPPGKSAFAFSQSSFNAFKVATGAERLIAGQALEMTLFHELLHSSHAVNVAADKIFKSQYHASDITFVKSRIPQGEFELDSFYDERIEGYFKAFIEHIIIYQVERDYGVSAGYSSGASVREFGVLNRGHTASGLDAFVGDVAESFSLSTTIPANLDTATQIATILTPYFDANIGAASIADPFFKLLRADSASFAEIVAAPNSFKAETTRPTKSITQPSVTCWDRLQSFFDEFIGSAAPPTTKFGYGFEELSIPFTRGFTERLRENRHDDYRKEFLRRIGLVNLDGKEQILDEADSKLIDNFVEALHISAAWFNGRMLVALRWRWVWFAISFGLLITIFCYAWDYFGQIPTTFTGGPEKALETLATVKIAAQIVIVLTGLYIVYQTLNKWLEKADTITRYQAGRAALVRALNTFEVKWSAQPPEKKWDGRALTEEFKSTLDAVAASARANTANQMSEILTNLKPVTIDEDSFKIAFQFLSAAIRPGSAGNAQREAAVASMLSTYRKDTLDQLTLETPAQIEAKRQQSIEIIEVKIEKLEAMLNECIAKMGTPEFKERSAIDKTYEASAEKELAGIKMALAKKQAALLNLVV